MVHSRQPVRAAVLFIVVVTVAFLTVIASRVMASPPLQNQKIVVGVIGSTDSPTFEAVTLAVQRFAPDGTLAVPGGAKLPIEVIAQDAHSPDEVGNAILRFKQTGVVAIFGPDADALTAQSANALAAAGVPIFTGATNTSIKTGGFVFRTRAGDDRQMAALAEVLTKDLQRNAFAVYQGSADVNGQVREINAALSKQGKPPAPAVIQAPGGAMADVAKALMATSPDTVIAFGDTAQTAELYRTLRGSNFDGLFVSPSALDPAFVNSLPDPLRGGVYGLTTWPYSWGSPDSIDFVADYVALSGQVPSALSAAAYDSSAALLAAIQQVGVDPNKIRAKIVSFPKSASIQGTFNPALGNNLLSADVFVTVSNQFGAPTLVARFDETGRLSNAPPAAGTPTRTPKPTLAPTNTRVPSATLQGVFVTVVSATVNVRSGPGTIYPKIGDLKKGEQVQVVGASVDFAWFVINFRQTVGWISSGPQFVKVFGDIRTLPIVQAPPTPTPLPTPTTPPFADLVVVSATMSPTVPPPGTPFTLIVVIKNQGFSDSGSFGMGITFQPGNVQITAVIQNLPAGQQATVNLTAGSGVPGTGNFSEAVVLDLNNQVNEGPNGKANNIFPVNYKIDKPYIATGSITAQVGDNIDFYGGQPDFQWDGTHLNPLGGTLWQVYPGMQLAQFHYDFLASGMVGGQLDKVALPVGSFFGVQTATGDSGGAHRAVIRVAALTSGGPITLEYYVY